MKATTTVERQPTSERRGRRKTPPWRASGASATTCTVMGETPCDTACSSHTRWPSVPHATSAPKAAVRQCVYVPTSTALRLHGASPYQRPVRMNSGTPPSTRSSCSTASRRACSIASSSSCPPHLLVWGTPAEVSTRSPHRKQGCVGAHIVALRLCTSKLRGKIHAVGRFPFLLAGPRLKGTPTINNPRAHGDGVKVWDKASCTESATAVCMLSLVVDSVSTASDASWQVRELGAPCGRQGLHPLDNYHFVWPKKAGG